MSRITIDVDRCKGCGLCTIPCPYHLVLISEQFNAKGYRPAAFIDPEDQCIGCANCAVMCPDAAIVVYRTRKPVQVARAGRPRAADNVPANDAP
jgi:2-oxoglutarate ferredoxin oxidoreductase subunit delta